MDEKKLSEVKEELERLEMGKYAQQELDRQMLEALEETLAGLRRAKPDERSELARRYAVTITELEKVVAYFSVYVVAGR